MMVNMEVVGVRIEMPSNQPIVLLKEIDGSRFLPIWVGAVEATAIAFAQQGVEPLNMNASEFSTFIKAETIRWTAISQAAGLTPE